MDAPHVRLARRPGHPHATYTLVAVAVLTGMSLPALVACTAHTRGSAGNADDRIITVTSTDDSCDLSTDTAPAGTLVYKVTNSGSTVTAFYLYDPDRQRTVGWVEDLAPGLSRDLVINLPAGTYVRSCEPESVAQESSGDFTVTGSRQRVPSGASQEQIDTATTQYKTYVEDQVTQLLAGTQEFVEAFAAGNDDEARRLYPGTRAHLRRIQPVLESFGELDLRIDGRAADIDPGHKWTGWHRIEKALWPPSDQPAEALGAAQRGMLARQLLRDTRTLHAGVRKLAFTGDQVGDAATRLLEEVATETVTGEEEVWSHSDLYDLQADIDGARAAFEALRPVLTVRNPGLEKQVARRFGELDARLRLYRVGDEGFVRYDTLTVEELRQLSDAVNSLAEPLSMVTAAVAM
jgi:iron uptake system component EfeO